MAKSTSYLSQRASLEAPFLYNDPVPQLRLGCVPRLSMGWAGLNLEPFMAIMTGSITDCHGHQQHTLDTLPHQLLGAPVMQARTSLYTHTVDKYGVITHHQRSRCMCMCV